MNECDSDVKTRQEQSYEFGEPNRPVGFEGQLPVSMVRSVVLNFNAVRRFMSNKPLRRQQRLTGRRCTIYLLEEEDGGYSAVAADLPGVASQGETEAEALENIKSAFREVIRCYRDDGRRIPWLGTPMESEPGAITRSVVVHG